MVLPLTRSGTTVGPCSTTAPAGGTTARSCGTTALMSSTTALPSSADKSYNCIDKENLGCSKGKRKGGARDDVYVMNPPNLSNADPLLIVRLPYDSIPPKRNKEKHRLP